jgi:hypothetical protein
MNTPGASSMAARMAEPPAVPLSSHTSPDSGTGRPTMAVDVSVREAENAAP